ncbi:hypothetical protein BuS5_00042 [Desulfosarcina sp. BuS5]|uniref:TylF/MycF/NovP-related O-methyltransferase n=1 Tax=Desulfosarcina sp. BuS5 TaxID=933262 RepID=UPI000684E981|nr:TylF/MycF/NovP-related O-methyltransferase [Desulfosarcina sp. BuS5]WDN87074.1 hypothetical protein BuS5_00042 [Desulfosarcina sp. BuS5]
MRITSILEKINRFVPEFVNRILYLSNNIVKMDNRFMAIYWQLSKEGRMLLSVREAYNIYHYVTEAVCLGGALAEFGVYKGGGAKLISSIKSDLALHLFDTFDGMPDVDETVDLCKKGSFSDTTLSSVREYLKDYPNIHFYKGFFPDTAHGFLPSDIEFCFVHIDVDIYESTIAALNYFYPRLKKGGVLISHDYYSVFYPGVKKAFEEFFLNKKEQVVHLWDTQCMVRKE